ncbi:MAG: hypothetical protein IJ160_13080 [Muribaculaceae bacterium]|nr:hypothetical protein [Muribaculaceae bacterium]
MKKKLLLLAMAVMAMTGMSAQDTDLGYTVQKISNPLAGERQVDGLIAGGDRENSYTWRLAMRGDEIYIATTRNIASALVNMYGSQFAAAGISLDTFWAMIDAVTNGDIPRNDANEGANIICYNRQTGEFKVVYTAERTVYFRMAVTFGDDVYFGSYSADPTVAQYILKLDPQGNFTKVFETMGSISLRANCEYDGHLFFAGADDREVVEDPSRIPTRMAVLKKSNNDDTVWDRVADYRDFGNVAYDPIMSSWAGAPIWELATHAGYIYATAPSTHGFVIFRGHPAQGDEVANEYGWYWEEVAGLNNGINNPGLSDVEGGEPGTMRSLIGSVFEFNGELYAYNFDHSFGGEAQAFAGLLQQLAGVDTKPSQYLYYMYNSLQSPQRVWKLDDASGKFVECENFTQMVAGTTNEYVWRMGEYDGQLYVATMDAGIFYNYMTQLTNGSLLTMTPEEMQSKIDYITRLIEIFANAKASELAQRLIDRLNELKQMLEQFAQDSTVNPESLAAYEELINDIIAMLEAYLNGQSQNDADAFATAALTTGIDKNTAPAQIVNASAKATDMPEDYVENLCNKAKASAKVSYDAAHKALADDIVALLKAALESIKQMSQELYDRIDGEGIEMYLYINDMVMNDDWGFDLYRTSDGVDFEVITTNGFNDKYNYGCPAFLATDEGMYIGTCNPFYGGQLYLLTNSKYTGVDNIAVKDSDEHSNIYYTLSGMRLVGKPTAPGIYVNDGRKVVIGAAGK